MIELLIYKAVLFSKELKIFKNNESIFNAYFKIILFNHSLTRPVLKNFNSWDCQQHVENKICNE